MEFRRLLDAEDKEGCVRYALSLLDSGSAGIPDLYEDVLAPAARERHCLNREQPVCIWEEHIRTSIIRTIIECCYPHLMEERRSRIGDGSRGRTIIVCPTEEYHELGARMTADFFTLCGFDVTFVGANTPQDEIVEAAVFLQPEYIGVSVTSPYNLVVARRTLGYLREARGRSGGTYRIVVGGQAFDADERRARDMGADALAQTFDDICELTGSIR